MLPSISFRSLLTQFAASEDRSYDPLQSIDELSVRGKLKFASWCNTAMDRLWRPPNAAFAWSWTTTNGIQTLSPDGSLPISSFANADWFNVWDKDPRPMDNPPQTAGWWGGNSAIPIKCVEDGTFIWPRARQGTVFMFWRTARPVFGNVVVVSANTYNIGQVVFDETATGHCYMALINGAAGNQLIDNTQWAVQAPPDRIGNVMAEQVETMRLQAKGSDGSSTVNQRDVETWLDVEMARELPRDGTGFPWQFNRWHSGLWGACR